MNIFSNIKAQADAQESVTYKLIDVKGGGELVQIMKEFVLQRKTRGLDGEIYRRVIDCVYDEGKGKDVNRKISRLSKL